MAFRDLQDLEHVYDVGVWFDLGLPGSAGAEGHGGREGDGATLAPADAQQSWRPPLQQLFVPESHFDGHAPRVETGVEDFLVW